MSACGLTAPEVVQGALDWLRVHAGPGARLVVDSRLVQPGDIFVASPGAASDARRFIPQALERGAVAALCEADGLPRPAPPQVLGITGFKAVVGQLAAQWLGDPSADTCGIAVTGTNGKTSCTHWIAHALEHLGRKPVLVGTLGAGFPDALNATGFTTPDPVMLQQCLADLRAQGADSFAIEASSIGIAEARLAGLHLLCAAFTNLTRDHLDYHGDMAGYEAAKAPLFMWPGLRAAVLNMDDAAGRRYASMVGIRGDVRVIGYAVQDDATWHKLDAANRLHATQVRAQATATAFRLEGCGLQREVRIATLGDYNVSNWLACLGSLIGAGFAADAACDALLDIESVEGRMQLIVGEPDAPLVVVDYAHTPDALEKVLRALRPVAQVRGGKLVAVFGCGGDRDPGKRPHMAAIAGSLADLAVLTSDNPRGESAEAILGDMRNGLGSEARAWSEADRRVAIRRVILEASGQDVVVIAGKGHERTQEIGGIKHPFYDPDEARVALAARNQAQAQSC